MTGATLGHPLVDRTLSNGKVIRAVAGFDATLSAPKSLSVLWALTGDDGLAECHDVAVRAVAGYLERFGATTRVRSNGMRMHPDTHGLTMAAFRQTTSRADDPQLHTHLVISAKVQTADERWLALDARFLKRQQRTLGGLYQSVLRAELTHRYGVAFEPIVNGQAEIAGVPTELLAVFSKRTAEIDTVMADKVAEFCRREGCEPTRQELAAMQRQAAADSRARKTGRTVDEMRALWRVEAATVDVTPASLRRSIDAAATERPPATPELTTLTVIDALAIGASSFLRLASTSSWSRHARSATHRGRISRLCGLTFRRNFGDPTGRAAFSRAFRRQPPASWLRFGRSANLHAPSFPTVASALRAWPRIFNGGAMNSQRWRFASQRWRARLKRRADSPTPWQFRSQWRRAL
ncbi:MAG: MobF family relaxase [Actinomycetota bacterium]